MVVHTGLQDGVHLDRVQARSLRALQPRQDAVQQGAAAHRLERLGDHGVQGHVDAVQARIHQLLGADVQTDGVGGQRNVGARLERGDPRDDLREIGAGERLSAGEAHLVHAEVLHADADESHDLIHAHQLVLLQELHAHLRHAVGAAEIAEVGEGDPEVVRGAAESVDEPRDVRAAISGEVRGGRIHRSRPRHAEGDCHQRIHLFSIGSERVGPRGPTSLLVVRDNLKGRSSRLTPRGGHDVRPHSDR